MLGALPGYWLGANDGRPESPFLSKDRWNQALLDAGFDGIDFVLDDYEEPASCTTVIVARNTGRGTRADHKDANSLSRSSGVKGLEKANGVESSTVTLVCGHLDPFHVQMTMRLTRSKGLSDRTTSFTADHRA